MAKEVKSEKSNDAYSAKNLEVLEGLDAVRMRPGMYIGSTGIKGLHHILWEIVDNAVDEAMAGYCNEINVEIFGDNLIKVVDNGRGMPTDIHPKTHVSTIETIFTVLHAGGKFDSNSYKVSGGLHGVGASVVNALSEWLEVYVERDGNTYFQRFERGKSKEPLKIIGGSERRGSTVVFKPDATIFKDTVVFDYETLRHRLQQLAFLNKGLKITISDKRDEKQQKSVAYQYDGGIVEYIKFLNKGKTLLHNDVIYIEEMVDGVQLEIAFQYSEEFSSNLYSFVNNIHTPEGGTHEEGFRTSLTRILNNYAKNNNLLKKEEGLSGDDVREGLTAIVSCQISEPQFEGQTKTKLGNTEVRRITSQIMTDQFDAYLKENPAAIAGSMGKSKGKEMLIWTPEEYKDFSFAIMDNPVSFYAFEMLYWTGIRLGELLALTPEAFDFEKGTVTIDKSYQRLKRRDVVTTPKSDGSIRVIVMPDFLRDEMKEYIEKLYKIGKDERLFLVSKSQMHREMSRGCEEAGLKRIRIHDLRHSHVSLLIHLGYSAVAIGKRMGHESEKITYMYAHLFPSEQKDMGNKLNKLREETA